MFFAIETSIAIFGYPYYLLVVHLNGSVAAGLQENATAAAAHRPGQLTACALSVKLSHN